MKSITVIGNVNLDVLVSPVTRLPEPGVDQPVDRMDTRTGGAAGNAALALAALGCPVHLVGNVGDDLFGQFVLDELRAAGITEGVAVVPGVPTCVSIAFEAPQRDRAFLTLLGSLDRLDEGSIPSDALSQDLVLLCGYFLLRALRGEPTRHILERVRAVGGMTFFDCGWDQDGWPPDTLWEIETLLPLVDVFLPNAAEASAITGMPEPHDAARALQRRTGGWIVIKRGEKGCLAHGPSGEIFEIPAPRVSVVDTIGAGDGLNAGLLYSLARGDSWETALHFGTRLASAIVSRPSHDRYPQTLD